MDCRLLANHFHRCSWLFNGALSTGMHREFFGRLLRFASWSRITQAVQRHTSKMESRAFAAWAAAAETQDGAAAIKTGDPYDRADDDPDPAPSLRRSALSTAASSRVRLNIVVNSLSALGHPTLKYYLTQSANCNLTRCGKTTLEVPASGLHLQ